MDNMKNSYVKILIESLEDKDRVLDEKFNDLKVLADSIKSSSNSYDRSGKCNQLLSKTDELDKFINQKFSGEELKKLREHLGFLVRDVAIQIYNKYNDEQNATSIITRLRNVFFTIPNLKEKLDADYNTLQSNKIGTSANTNKYNPSNNSYSNSSKKNNSGCLWRLIVFGIIGICIYFSLRDTTSSSSTKPNTSYTSTPRSTYSTSKPTTPPSVTKPSTGYIFYNKYGDNPCELDITNNFNNDIYCKFVDKSGTVVKRFYVRSNTTAKIPMPVGTYELRFASGSTWYGESQLFGSYTSYSKDPDAYTFSYGDVWTVTYYTTTNSSGGDSVKKISAADF